MPEISAHVPRTVSSTSELLAIAHAMEMEAGRRYRDLAARMRLRGNAALAELFTFLGGIEEKHASKIDSTAISLTGRAAEPAHVRWDLPENFDEEQASSRLLTPYLALAIAVRNEERSFAFYCYVAAEAPSENIREFAEALAKEELDHARLLRRERRKAYRAEDGGGRRAGRGKVPDSVDELLAAAAEMEGAAAPYHAALASRLEATDANAARSFARAASDEAQTAESISARLGHAIPRAPITAAPTLEDGLRILEALFEFYADVAERSTDEDIVREAQALAERAVHRLSLTHGSLEKVPFS